VRSESEDGVIRETAFYRKKHTYPDFPSSKRYAAETTKRCKVKKVKGLEVDFSTRL
jgi:hypothetical protein